MGKIVSTLRKVAKIGLGCLLVAIVVLPISSFVLTRLLYQVTGEPYFDNAWDRAKSQRIAEPYDPVIVAIGKHRATHGNYPKDLEGLDTSIERIQQAKSFLDRRNRTVYYRVNDGEFIFQVKLNWDGGINFQSRLGHWRYDPGNGDPDWPIHQSTSN